MLVEIRIYLFGLFTFAKLADNNIGPSIHVCIKMLDQTLDFTNCIHSKFFQEKAKTSQGKPLMENLIKKVVDNMRI